MLTQYQIDAIVDASRQADEGPTQLVRRVEAAMAEQAEALRDDLQEAARTLRRYEELHRAKNTPDSLAKAEANATLAARFERTLSTLR